MKMMRIGFTYIMTNKRYGTLYVGVTNDLLRRVQEHKQEVFKGFTQQYGLHMLVWYELHESIEDAILREKRIKEWKRQWKINLIEQLNPLWSDLSSKIIF